MGRITNSDCGAKDTGMCEWLDRSCHECYLNSLKKDEQEKAAQNWVITQGLLPDSVNELNGDKCMFCKGEPKPRSCAATLEIAHQQPDSQKAMFFGLGKKVTNPIGSMLMLKIACCKDCRRAFVLHDLIKWIIIVAFGVVGLLVLSIPSVSAALSAGGELMPFVALVAIVVVGVVGAMVVSNAYVRAKAKEVHLDVRELSQVQDMFARGWFLPNFQPESGKLPALLFTKKTDDRPVKSLFVGENAKEKAE